MRLLLLSAIEALLRRYGYCMIPTVVYVDRRREAINLATRQSFSKGELDVYHVCVMNKLSAYEFVDLLTSVVAAVSGVIRDGEPKQPDRGMATGDLGVADDIGTRRATVSVNQKTTIPR